MTDTKRTDTELIDEDDEFQIVDLDPPASPRQRQAARMIKLIGSRMANPWVRYGLSGTLALILLGALFLPWLHSAPATPPSNPPRIIHPTLRNATFARDLILIQDSDNTLTAFQLSTGRPRWHVTFPSAARINTSDQTRVYCFFTTAKNTTQLEALDINTGKPLWHDTLPAASNTPLFSGFTSFTFSNFNTTMIPAAPDFVYQDHVLYIPTSSNIIYAIHAENGQTKWTYRVQVSNQSVPAAGPILEGAFSDLNIQTNVLSFISLDATTHLLDAETGQELLSFPGKFTTTPAGSSSLDLAYPIVDGHIAYLLPTSEDTPIRAFSLSDGRLLWTHKLPQGASAEETNGIVYIGDASNSRWTALRGSDGQQIWSYHASDGQALLTDYLDKPGTDYLLQHDGTVVCIRASDGQILWRTRFADLAIDASQSTSLALLNDTLVLFNGSNSLGILTTTPFYVLSASTGHLLWRSPMPSGPFQLLGDSLYTIQLNGQVDAWRDSDGQHLWDHRNTAGSTLVSSADPTVSQIFLRDLTGNLSILSASSGKLLWTYP